MVFLKKIKHEVLQSKLQMAPNVLGTEPMNSKHSSSFAGPVGSAIPLLSLTLPLHNKLSTQDLDLVMSLIAWYWPFTALTSDTLALGPPTLPSSWGWLSLPVSLSHTQLTASCLRNSCPHHLCTNYALKKSWKRGPKGLICKERLDRLEALSPRLSRDVGVTLLSFAKSRGA